MDDQALIRALQAGERSALRRTMEVYAGYTSAVLGNTLRGQASREDLEGRYALPGAFKAYRKVLLG